MNGLLQLIGVTLLHSLWQITLIAIIVATFIRAGQRLSFFESANSRYLVLCCGLLLMLLIPITTFCLSQPLETSSNLKGLERATQHDSSLHHRSQFFDVGFEVDEPGMSAALDFPQSPVHSRSISIESRLNYWLVGVACCWLIGAMGMMAVSIRQWKGVWRLSRLQIQRVPDHVVKTCESLVAKLNVRQRVEVGISNFIDVPMLIGCLKPIILLPPSMLTGLSPRELELILMHELAHVRRYDYLVNVIQTFIESVLFFHPCVWWMSRKIRIEREFASDEFVVQFSRDKVAYAKALFQIEQFRCRAESNRRPALAATDGSLLTRVERIVAFDLSERTSVKRTIAWPRSIRHAWFPTVLLVLPVLLAGLFHSATLFPDPDNNKETVTPLLKEGAFPVTEKKKPNDALSYKGVDMSKPINQWQKAIETRDAEEVARLLKEHPDFANTKIMDRYRDGRLNTKGHHQEALDHVARTGHLEIAKLLVEAGANEERIRGAFMIAEPNVTEFLLEHCDDPAPNVGLMAYIGKAKSMQFWFDRGYKPEMQMLHDACCGRPSMRHFAKRDDSKGKWRENFRETVRVLIEAGADVNERTLGGNVKWDGAKPWRKNGETPLHIAASSHDIVLIQQLLDAGADKTLKNDLGDTPCCWAIRYNAPAEVVELLDFEGNTRRNPELWWAAHSGDLDKVKEMIEAGADPNAYEENGSGTLLNFHPEVTKYLLEQGANPDLQRNENIIPVLVGVAGFNTDCVKAMLDAGANPNIASEHNAETALHHSVCGDRFEEVKALLEAGADPNEPTHNDRRTFIGSSDGQCHGETCLHRAAVYGTPEVIKLLLENGADLSKKDADGLTPLDWAIKHERDGLVIDSLGGTKNDDSNIIFVSPDHPFIVAVREVDLARVKELIANDNSLVNVQVRGSVGLTGKVWRDGKYRSVTETASERAGPLHFAAFHGHSELAQLLIDMGADINLSADFGEKDGSKSSAVGLAAWQGDAATLKVLLDAAKDTKMELDLNPKLHSALAHSAWEKAELLLEHGATHDICTAAQAGDLDELKRLIDENPDSVDRDEWNYGRTPLEQALTVGQVKSAELLAAHGATISPKAFVAMGRMDEIKELLEKDSDAATRKFGNYPLLCWAIMGGQVEAVKFLLENGADPEGTDDWSVTPLRYSTQVKGEAGAAIVNLLVAAGADVSRVSRGYTPLECAENNQAVREAILFHKENYKFTDLESKFWTAVSDGDLETVKACLKEDAALASKRFPTGNRLHSLTNGFPLCRAAAKGHWEIARLLLDHGVDPDAKLDLEEHRELGMPIMFAYEQGNFAMVNLLLDKGASVHAHPYCDHSFASVVYRDANNAGAPTSMVLRSVPDLDAEDQKKIESIGDDASEVIKLYDRILSLGAVPDHGAIVQAGDFDTVELLLKNHPTGSTNYHGGGNVHEALLYSSAWYGSGKVCEMSLDICADRHTTYAAQHCIRSAITSHNRPGTFADYYRVVELNLDYLKARDAFNEHETFTPLQCLADGFVGGSTYGPCPEPPTVEQQLKLAKLCLDKGVDVNHVTPSCTMTALDLAMLHNQKEYAEFLRNNGGKQTPAGEKQVKEREGLPRGSYLESCRNVRLEKGDDGTQWLVAECRKIDGTWVESRLHLKGQSEGISNNDGHLQFTQ